MGDAARRERLGLAALALLVATGVAVRCAVSSITHDEALTYTNSVTARVADIVRFRVPGPPDNNRLLFTLLAKLAVATFGNHEWSLRLPSLLAFIAYAWLMALILRRWLSGAALLLGFAVAIGNPAILEMMSIACGYGLGIAGVVAGTLCILRGAERGQRWRGAWWTAAATCMAAATLAHLSMLLFLLVMLALTNGIELFGLMRRRRRLRLVALAMAGPVGIAALLAPLLRHQVAVLAPAGLLATEGLTSFHADTVLGTVCHLLADLAGPGWLFGSLGLSAYTVPAIAVVVLLTRRGSTNGRTCADLAILLALLLGVSLASIAQHYLAGVAYLSGRRALSLLPILLLVCGCLAREAPLWSWPMLRPALAGLGLAALAGTANPRSFDSTFTWRYDADTRAMMADLQRLLAQRPGAAPLRLGIGWIFEPSINYYRVRDGMTGLAPVDRTGPFGPYDLYYLERERIYIGGQDLAAVTLRLGSLRILKAYARSGTVIAAPETSKLTGIPEP